MTKTRLARNVIVLGIVSLLTDASSEMIMPIMPLFLTEVLHAGAAFLGLIDGIADTTAAFAKLASGAAADRAPTKKPFVVIGYGIASVVRPLVALATAPWHVLAVRFTDRIGKGIRSAPRDAVLAASTAPADQGRAFGFHQAMDHIGAVIGPAAALVMLRVWGLSYRAIFAYAAIPGGLALLVVSFGLENTHVPPKPHPATWQERFGLRGTPLSPTLKRYLVVVALFTLAASTDTFLILKAREVGIALWMTPIVWIVLHVVRSSLTTWGGALSDRHGRRVTIRAGWLIYGVAYVALGFVRTPWQMWALTAFYGTASSLYDGGEKALIAQLAPAAERGRAFGVYHFTVGLCALPASLGFGALWEIWSSRVAFVTGGVLALVAAAGLGWALRDRA